MRSFLTLFVLIASHLSAYEQELSIEDLTGREWYRLMIDGHSYRINIVDHDPNCGCLDEDDSWRINYPQIDHLINRDLKN